MAANDLAKRTGADVRAKLSHPVLDGDAHVQECEFAMPDFLKKAAGARMVEKWEEFRRMRTSNSIGTAVRTTLWNVPSGPASIDRAMAMLPRLRKERHQDAGIDYAVIYTTLGLGALSMADDELRQATCRALNMMNADMFAEVKDSMTPSALIPMVTPAEAIAELEFAVKELGFKTVTVGETWTSANGRRQIRSLAMDSPHDFDPVWKKCVELKVSVACHSGAREAGGRRGSPSNFVFNHLGSFAAGSEYFCRSIFMGGVTRRFPQLKFALLEGGVAWGCTLYNDIYEHWEKRNLAIMREYLDPAKLDMDLMVRMFEKYGNSYLTPEQIKGYRSTFNARIDEDPDKLDDFKALGPIEKPEDLKELFVPSFYFGCEADDRMIAVAFDERMHHYGAKIKACFGSDIGHWDVLDALSVLPECHAMVGEGLLTDEDFKDFVFTNNVTLHASLDPDFFKGTTIEREAAAVMAAQPRS